MWDSFTHAFENQRAVVTPPVNIPSDLNDPQSVDAATGNNYWAASLLPDRDDVSEPFSVITIPMYDSLENVRLDTTKKQPLVAVLTFSIFWQQLFQDILPEDDDELYVVFDDACSPSYTFTYRLQGPTATYMGTGDIHPTTSNQHVISAPLLNLIRHDRYSGLPLSTNFCFKTISVYPCKHKSTSGPAIYTSVAALIFFFTSIVFLAFDYSVGRRQRIVIQRALASSAIVSHLFPSERIREELYKQKIESSQNESQTASSKETASSFLQMTPNSTNNLPTPPVAPSTLAESYQHTTVLLADLVGFSSWSSHREPAAIFQVLEAIFSKMDEVASKSNIFKVDAICTCHCRPCFVVSF